MGITTVIASVLTIASLAVLLILLGVAWFCIANMGVWVEARAAGLPMGFVEILLVKLRKLPLKQILASLKTLWKAGQRISPRELEDHIMAGGDLEQVTAAAVAADKAGLQVTFRQIADIDLAGRDVVSAVESHVNPKVLECPAPGTTEGNHGITGVTKDGVCLGVRVRITVRTRLDKLVGGAGEATIIARVGEGIVTTLGKTKSHQEILARPELIAENILKRGLDASTCFEIMSVDVMDIDVLDNVNARLESFRAETDKRIAQARAEEARANAVAVQQEMKAVNLQNEAAVVSAKKELPEAFTTALKSGRFGNPKPLKSLLPDKASLWKHGTEAFRG